MNSSALHQLIHLTRSLPPPALPHVLSVIKSLAQLNPSTVACCQLRQQHASSAAQPTFGHHPSPAGQEHLQPVPEPGSSSSGGVRAIHQLQHALQTYSVGWSRPPAAPSQHEVFQVVPHSDHSPALPTAALAEHSQWTDLPPPPIPQQPSVWDGSWHATEPPPPTPPSTHPSAQSSPPSPQQDAPAAAQEWHGTVREQELYNAYLQVCAAHAQAPLPAHKQRHFELFKEQLQAELRTGEQAIHRSLKRKSATEKFGEGPTAVQRHLRPVAMSWMEALQGTFERELAKVRRSCMHCILHPPRHAHACAIANECNKHVACISYLNMRKYAPPSSCLCCL